ncbi:SDR family oxidoreductase [Pelagibacterium lentulum]|uniref:NAD(P)-dependent oxidoreductase n=1 Tax=Pelagibacterium lentulum TaxID=2029865 RepID=A0A916R9N6_9HYPH|nr:SDR family oxidoreductase [Pelagibacterium lentulum]GGA45054.1 NAD(P)-dependent oxidoreductase [Pelagibacterium lentulum]
MLGITGATGQLGRLVIQSLKDKGLADQAVALVRNPNKAENLEIAARPFDYDQAPATLAASLQGIEKLLLISASEVGKRVAQHRNVIDAAKAAGIKKIIYTSLLHADTSPIGLASDHRQTEAAITGSGIAYTILRNSWYTENYTGNLKAAVENGVILGATQNAQLTTASRYDLAEAAVKALTGEGHENRTYELAGIPFTLSVLADETATQSGKPVIYKDLPQADYAETLQSFGLPAPVAEMIASADADAANGALYDQSGDLARLLGRTPQPLSDAVRDALQ